MQKYYGIKLFYGRIESNWFRRNKFKIKLLQLELRAA